ncbi:MAG: rRNA maturation RNase YbeY [Ardenticatenaceae bacterium]|nr:rRNA maturation RNase YbeY [Ardenticatenaceae bacterium]MCB9443083.1 rRNA maturation RNase YbeY [Ardenticatenaceae bacterium]
MMTGYSIDLQIDDDLPNEQRPLSATLDLLETAVVTTLKQQQSPKAALTVFLTDDGRIQQLNRDFLGHDKPTDVLSFPAGVPMPGMETLATYLGDIIIALPYAARQAAAAGHDADAELQLLAVHGALHLLGHDHAAPEEKAIMWAAQTAVLTQLGLAHITPTEN